MNLGRILKSVAALLSGQGINLFTQFLLPPLFLKYYGISNYGEWLTLSAAVSYLSTLNFGLQTYASNQAGICFSRGELAESKTLQGTALLILTTLLSATAALTALVFLFPVSSWLRLHIGEREAAATIFLLGLQMLVRMFFGLYSGGFLVAGVSYRGAYWGNAQSIATLLITAICVFRQFSFAAIAAQQLATVSAFSLALAFDLRRTAPDAFPRLQDAQRSRILEILKPSLYFALLFFSNFLVYQLPVVLMQRILGPSQVVVFSISRTIFSMSRQALTSLTNAIGPEVIELYGRRNWQMLARLYDTSERFIFALVPIVNLGTFVATPVLLTIWVHKPELFNWRICLLMALISAVIGIKEHKYQFQTSANQHSGMAKFLVISYILMICISIPAMSKFGLIGFLWAWLIVESIQLSYILYLNRLLFERQVTLTLFPLYKLAALLLSASLAAAGFFLLQFHPQTYWAALFAALSIAGLAVSSYFLFGVDDLRVAFLARILRNS